MFYAALSYQAGFFADFENITPNADTIPPLLNAFRDLELLPTTFIQFSEGKRHTRLRMATSTNEWFVDFDVHRINITKNPISHRGSNMGDIGEFSDKARDFVERIHKLFPRAGTRLSLVTKNLLEERDDEQLKNAYRRVLNPSQFYVENPPHDWRARYVSRVSTVLDGNEEQLNVITTISRIQGEFSDMESVEAFDKLQLEFDINTFQGNRTPRFDPEDLRIFFGKAMELREKLADEVQELLNG